MKTRIEIAREFLADILGDVPPGACIEIRSKRPADKGAKQEWLTKVEQFDPTSYPDDVRVWYGVAQRRAGGRGSIADLLTIGALFVDMDKVAHRDTRVGELKRFAHPPTYIVDSGGGLHAYWKLKQRLDLSDSNHVTYVREVVHGLAHILKGDTAVHDPSRVLGVPGTMNAGNGRDKVYVPIRMVTVVHHDPAALYDVGELARYRRSVLTAPEPVADPTAAEIAVVADGPAVPAPAVDTLPVDPDIRDLIRDGAPQGKRSETDAKVVSALVRAGVAPAAIDALYRDPVNKIGEKYREAGNGPRYLKRTIAKATAWKEVDTTMREASGRLMLKRGKEWVVVSDRPITARAKFKGDITGYYVEVLTPEGPEFRTLRAEDFASANALKRALRLSTQWYGTDVEAQRLAKYLEDQNAPVRTPVQTIGWHDGSVVFPNARLSPTGEMLKNDEMQYIGEMLDASLDDDPDWDVHAREALTHYAALHTNGITVPAIGWMAATFLAPQVRHQDPEDAFPFLMLYGEAWTGKTTILRRMQALVGSRARMRAARDVTPFMALQHLSQSNTLPFFVDEYRRANHWQQEKLYDLFRLAYNNGIANRGKADHTYDRYPLTAPIAIAGEMPFKDAATLRRTVSLRVEKQFHNKTAYDALPGMPLTRFNAGMYRHAMKVDVPGLYIEAYKRMPAEFKGTTDEETVNWRVITFGLLILESIMGRTWVDEQIARLPAYREGAAEVIGASTKNLIRDAVRVLRELIRQQRVRINFDFVLREENGRTLLYFYPTTVLAAIEEYHRKWGSSDVLLTEETMKMYMKSESEKPDTVIATYNKPARVGQKTHRCTALDLTAIEDQFGIPVENWTINAVGETDRL